jgi:hypothetical protein
MSISSQLQDGERGGDSSDPVEHRPNRGDFSLTRDRDPVTMPVTHAKSPGLWPQIGPV